MFRSFESSDFMDEFFQFIRLIITFCHFALVCSLQVLSSFVGSADRLLSLFVLLLRLCFVVSYANRKWRLHPLLWPCDTRPAFFLVIIKRLTQNSICFCVKITQCAHSAKHLQIKSKRSENEKTTKIFDQHRRKIEVVSCFFHQSQSIAKHKNLKKFSPKINLRFQQTSRCRSKRVFGLSTVKPNILMILNSFWPQLTHKNLPSFLKCVYCKNFPPIQSTTN